MLKLFGIYSSLIPSSWLKVLGEYSYTAFEYEPQDVLEQLFSLLERKFEGKHTYL